MPADLTWPPGLEQLKLDAAITGDRDDDRLTQVLEAAISFVRDVHSDRYNVDDESGSDLPDVPGHITMGTLRLALRWHKRRQSQDGMVNMAELGAGRVTSYDTDIDRMLRIGRFAPPVIA